MPATFVKSYAAPDGSIFPTLAEEQRHELTALVTEVALSEKLPDDSIAKLVLAMVDRREDILAILRQKERKNLRAPKVERKPRTPKAKPETT